MRRVPLLIAATTLVLLAGCGQTPPGATPSVSHPAGSTSVTPTAPDASASLDPTTGPLAFPSTPDPASALDVSKTVAKAGFASFASPSGKIWCALYRDYALCHFPFDYAGKIPKSKAVCPDDPELDVTGVMVDAKKVGYFCSGDPEANPALEDSDSGASTGWWKPTGWPSVELDGQKLATLPYGKTLVSGDFICGSQPNGVTCGDTANDKVFRMSRAGVAWMG